MHKLAKKLTCSLQVKEEMSNDADFLKPYSVAGGADAAA
jgi:hypothetical protein